MCFTDHMTDLETMPVQDTDLLTDEAIETEEPTAAHIVKVKPGENAQAVVLEARIMGIPVEALCGFTWVPSRDPKNLPLCEECKAMYGLYKDFNDNLSDTPSD
jgi:hypothetical protein